MFYFIFSFIMACFGNGHSENGNHNNSGQVTTYGDTSGETGTLPPRKP